MVRGLFEQVEEVGVSGIVVWVPVLPGDDVHEAASQAAAWREERVIHLWDGAGRVSAHVAHRLSLNGPGWDLYLLYGRSMRWEDDHLPEPAFWMHQLSPEVGADPALSLREYPDRLRQLLGNLLTPSQRRI